MANSFEHISITAVKVLARLAAERVIKEKLRDQGVRVSLVPMRDVRTQADLYLSHHPELFDQAKERARLMGLFERKPRRKQISEPMVTPDLADHNS
jgi:hypothetical protein